MFPETETSSTMTYYQQLAERFLRDLEELVAIIPQLEIEHETTAAFVRTHLNIPTEFLRTAIAGVEQFRELQVLDKLDVRAARDTLQFIEAFRPVHDRLAFVTRTVWFTMSARKASLSMDALQIYSIAKGIARDPGSAHIAAFVQLLKRDLGRSGPKGPRSAPEDPAQSAA